MGFFYSVANIFSPLHAPPFLLFFLLFKKIFFLVCICRFFLLFYLFFLPFLFSFILYTWLSPHHKRSIKAMVWGSPYENITGLFVLLICCRVLRWDLNHSRRNSGSCQKEIDPIRTRLRCHIKRSECRFGLCKTYLAIRMWTTVAVVASSMTNGDWNAITLIAAQCPTFSRSQLPYWVRTIAYRLPSLLINRLIRGKPGLPLTSKPCDS